MSKHVNTCPNRYYLNSCIRPCLCQYKHLFFVLLCIVIQLCNVNQHNAHFLKLMFENNSSCLLHVSNFMCSSSGRPFVHAVFYGIYLCIYVSSLAGGKMCLILRYCDLVKIKILYVYIKLFRPIILTSAPSITNTFKRILTSKCLCKVWFCFLVNILRRQDEAE